MLIGDFHIHGKYARACSTNTTIGLLEKNARLKGIDVLGTGDMQHPLWNTEILNNLKEDENGILWSKTKFPFIWQTEISLMYSHNGRGRRIHHVVLAPSKDVVKQIIDALLKKGRLDYDGRPIFGINSIEFVDMMRSISTDIEIIPGHVWTPFFGLFGSKTGFDTVEECFEERSKYIHALETGMSSDIIMNRRYSKLDKYNLVSFSDAHSSHPWRMGREATLFDVKNLTYKNILNAIRTGKGLVGTIEVNPAYGKYHVDGHRNCDVKLGFEESKRLNRICPKCKHELTIGVEYRIEELADRPKEYRHKDQPGFHMLTPLHELIASLYNITNPASKKVWGIYNAGVKKFGNEFNIAMKADLKSLNEVFNPKLSELIVKDREGKTRVEPGYDGVYGKVILSNEERIDNKQKSLSEF
ncbi:MAG TPA: endonuclease Q family protein [Candidatus Nanoarchaeia archaeon]|nr:endonuclease Q family protein [Candidatus Nanoarchaeia archaeon]